MIDNFYDQRDVDITSVSYPASIALDSIQYPHAISGYCRNDLGMERPAVSSVEPALAAVGEDHPSETSRREETETGVRWAIRSFAYTHADW